MLEAAPELTVVALAPDPTATTFIAVAVPAPLTEIFPS